MEDKKISHGVRFKPFTFEEMDEAQRKVALRVVGPPRGRAGPIWSALLRVPEIAGPYEEMGEYIRFRTSIPADLIELFLLVIARLWCAHHVWHIHVEPALKAGIRNEVIEQLKAGVRPDLDRRQSLVFDLITGLHYDRKVSDATFEAMEAEFGTRMVIEMAGSYGYYHFAMIFVQLDNVPCPSSMSQPLEPLKTPLR